MKNTILITCFTLFFLSSALAFTQQPDQNMHIYILMGQSNMAGRGEITEPYKKQEHPRVVMLNKEKEWVLAKHPLHFDKPKAAGVGPGLSFGIKMAEAYPGVTIGLVPCAVGGTSIRKWVPGGYDKVTLSHPYDDAVLRIKEAMKKGVIKGVLWLQGEGDSGSMAAIYLDKLDTLIAEIRKEVTDSQLPFVVGELARYRESYLKLNKEFTRLSSKIPYTAVVSSEGLWHKGDGTHFDSPSASAYGRRFAEGMLLLQHKGAKMVKPKSAGKVNQLTDQEKKKGWELLFDGKDPDIKWRSINEDTFPKEGWEVRDGMLVLLPGRKGRDIITREQFCDFELVMDYKLADSANTGIKYFVSALKKLKGGTELNGPEFQLIDDFKHETIKDNKSPETSTGSLYLLYAPQHKALNKPGKWNQVRIVATGKHVEHWLNGQKILSYERGSEELRKLVAGTKFKEYQDYGETGIGYILLQDHGDKAYFRNIKIRRIK
ncbi:sialate O-acetylesterase [Pedobacter heparinus]|uniref:sialate O-acetylesterase n=1 Tax=Pedobacter heparinus TaxID=984 RepID=UPI0029312D57|nr:sialate O-acetylesterase [Pedobacter heparinus]